ncbi:MAG: FABP family protein [Actinomycetota bacterium]
MDPAPVEQLEPLAFLLGTWRGSGRGIYPTIDAFGYEEEARFTHTGRPFLVYSSKTWHPDDGRPMHAESGFIRISGEARIEMVIAHAFGITEIGEGHVDGTSLEVTSTALASSSTAKTVDAISRTLLVDAEVLSYEIGMSFGGHELQNHLKARLEKVG